MSDIISLIVPIYNVEPFLRECLDSIIGQTYRDLEIILVDDGSPDNCGAICDEYARQDSRIQVIHKKNEGVSVARNVGIDAAHGDWIMFVDPDDWIELDYCEMLLKDVGEKRWDVIFGRLDHYIEDGTKCVMQRCTDPPYSEGREEILKRQIDVLAGKDANRGIASVQTGALINRELLENKACRFPPGVKKRQDFVFYFRITEFAQNVYYADRAVYHYRVRKASVCHRYNPEILDYVLGYCHAATAFVEEYHADDPIYAQKLGSGLIGVYSEIVWIYCLHSESKGGFERYKECMDKFCADPCVKKYIGKGSASDFAGLPRKVKCWGMKHKCVHLTYALFWLKRIVRKKEA